MRNVRHEMEALAWLNRMLDPWLVIGHPKGLPHCSIGAPHVCGSVTLPNSLPVPKWSSTPGVMDISSKLPY
ncbi:unnamed protein product [Arctogadus glacialis]